MDIKNKFLDYCNPKAQITPKTVLETDKEKKENEEFNKKLESVRKSLLKNIDKDRENREREIEKRCDFGGGGTCGIPDTMDDVVESSMENVVFVSPKRVDKVESVEINTTEEQKEIIKEFLETESKEIKEDVVDSAKETATEEVVENKVVEDTAEKVKPKRGRKKKTETAKEETTEETTN